MNTAADSITDQVGDLRHRQGLSKPGTCEGLSSPGPSVRREERTAAITGRPTRLRNRSRNRKDRKGTPLTRALRSHQLWLTITYLGLLVLMARGIAS
jgi:hypothetical protein